MGARQHGCSVLRRDLRRRRPRGRYRRQTWQAAGWPAIPCCAFPANAAFPLSKRIDLGVGRSIVVQFPVPLKDVLVSDPTMLDAVVQSSDRVFLIAKKTGPDQRLLLRRVRPADPDARGRHRRRPLGARPAADAASSPARTCTARSPARAIVLTGTVRTPIDSKRAAADRRAVRRGQRRCRQRRHVGPSAQPRRQQLDHHQHRRPVELPVEQQIQHRRPALRRADDVYAAKPVINLLASRARSR